MSEYVERISREILEILYSNRSTSIWDTGEVSRETLQDALNYKPNQIDKSVKNLGAHNYIKINYSIWSNDWKSAEITSKGIEYYESLEDKDEFNIELISSEILDILYAQFERSQDSLFDSDEVSIDKLYDVINYLDRHIDRTLKYLEAKGLIELSTSFWSGDVIGAKISQKGIDYHESKKLAVESIQPKASPQTIHIHGDVHGPISQTSDSDTYNFTTIFEGINIIRALIESNEDMDEDIKEKAFEHLNIIEGEAKSDKPNKGVISRSGEWLKRNTPRFLESIITKVIAGLLLRAI